MTSLTTDNAVHDASATQPDLASLAQQARWQVIKTVTNAKAGHIGGPLSMMDLLVTLYFEELRVDPSDPRADDRDRFVLSKGHAAIGLYSVLALRGFLPLDELATFDKGDSRLQGHPDVTRLPGLDSSTGSLGQGLSVGVGMALGARMGQKDFHTWVMLGDGEIQEGMIWEAVQVAARYKLSNLTAIVDRNGLQQFGLPSSAETTLTDRGDRRDPWFGVDLAAVFQAFGWRVVEINGHDYGQIRNAYKLARAGDYERAAYCHHRAHGERKGPVLGRRRVHLAQHCPNRRRLRKGPPRARARRARDSRQLPHEQERSPGVKAMRDVWGDKLVELGATDPRTVVLDGDLGNSTKVDKFAKAHPERFFQMGIAEQNLVGAAAGLASVGYVPWTSSFAVFFTHRAIDPIRMLVAQSHANVKIVGSYSGLLIGAVGKTHLDVQDLAIMRAMPDMTVLSPADEAELISMMDWAQAYEGPVYLRIVRDAVPDVFDADYTFTPGAVYRLREGTDVAMVSTGPQVSRVLAASVQLAEQGVAATVVHVPCIKPLDEDALRDSVAGHDLVVTVEEHSVMGGLGGLVAETLTATGPSPRIERIGINDTWGESAGNDFMLTKYGLSPELVSERVLSVLAARVPS